MGFPVISVDVKLEKGLLVASISQRRFLLFEDPSLSDKKTYRLGASIMTAKVQF